VGKYSTGALIIYIIGILIFVSAFTTLDFWTIVFAFLILIMIVFVGLKQQLKYNKKQAGYEILGVWRFVDKVSIFAVISFSCAAITIVVSLEMPREDFLFSVFFAAAFLVLGVNRQLKYVARQREQMLQGEVNKHEDKLHHMINQGKVLVGSIGYAKEKIVDAAVKEKISILLDTGRQIFDSVEESPEKVEHLASFLENYLPITVNLLESYVKIEKQKVRSQVAENYMNEVANSLDNIIMVFVRQLESFTLQHMHDISTDLDVLNSLIKLEGLE